MGRKTVGMRPFSRPWLAPLLDAACLVAFAAAGRDSHGVDGGAGWWVRVLAPLFTGWFVVAVATHLYSRRVRIWAALAVTWLGGIAVASLLRGAFTDRPYVSTYTVVAAGFIGLTTFGWRAIRALVVRARDVDAAAS
jgi:hypothetical protein